MKLNINAGLTNKGRHEAQRSRRFGRPRRAKTSLIRRFGAFPRVEELRRRRCSADDVLVLPRALAEMRE
jgi:hypothetical protein